MTVPQIHTPLPGPKAAHLLEEDATYVSPSYTRSYPLVVQRGEAAMKLARYATGRHRFIAFFGAFHGRTMGALSLTCSKTVQVRRFGPLLSHIHHVPFPNCNRCPFDLAGTGAAREGCCRGYLRY